MNDIAEVTPKMNVAEKAAVLTRAMAASPENTVKILVDAGVIEAKPWWSSVGINGSAAAAAGSIAVMAVAVAKFAGYEIDIQATELLIAAILGLASAAATWWGRLHAAQPISRTQVTPGLTLKE